MATLSTLRSALAGKLQPLGAQCSGYVLANPTPPFFDIDLGDPAIEYDQAFVGGHDLWRFTVRGCVAFSLDQAAQMKLDAWVSTTGSSSVKALLEADQTLGGAAQTVRVVELAAYRPLSNTGGQIIHLGAEWTVEVRAAR